jgi:hypothetical protein
MKTKRYEVRFYLRREVVITIDSSGDYESIRDEAYDVLSLYPDEVIVDEELEEIDPNE